MKWYNDGKQLVLVVPGRTPNGWYKPYSTDFSKPTSVVVDIDNSFLLCFDDIKKNVFGREIK